LLTLCSQIEKVAVIRQAANMPYDCIAFDYVEVYEKYNKGSVFYHTTVIPCVSLITRSYNLSTAGGYNWRTDHILASSIDDWFNGVTGF